MAFKVGKRKQKGRQSPGGRVQMNYYRRGPAESGASPFARKSAKTSRARKYFVRSLDIVILIILLVGAVYSLLIKPTPKVQINNLAYHPAVVYQTAAAKDFSALKNRNKVTFNEESLSVSLRKQFPEISSVSVELPIFSETPVVRLNIAKPSFFLASGNLDYIVDSQGVATSAIPKLTRSASLVTLTDQSGFAAHIGGQVLSAQSVSFINNLLAQTTYANVPVKSLVLPPQALELDLRTTDQSYYVKFYLGGDPLLQAGQFLAARHNFSQSGQQPSQYLDVRVPGRIFYK